VKDTKKKGGNKRQTSECRIISFSWKCSREPVVTTTIKYEPICFKVQKNN
jgi:hypothetical protein